MHWSTCCANNAIMFDKFFIEMYTLKKNQDEENYKISFFFLFNYNIFFLSIIILRKTLSFTAQKFNVEKKVENTLLFFNKKL